MFLENGDVVYFAKLVSHFDSKEFLIGFLLNVVFFCFSLSASLFLTKILKKSEFVKNTKTHAVSIFVETFFPFALSILSISFIAILDQIGITYVYLSIALKIVFTLYLSEIIAYLISCIFHARLIRRFFIVFFNIIIWGITVLKLLGIQKEVVDKIENISIVLGKITITPIGILETFSVLFLAVVTALFIWQVIEDYIRTLEDIEPNIMIAISRIGKILFSVLFIFLALPYVGFDISNISMFFGAFAVGLGFGFQKIASSYISGIILLIERSICIDDMVRIDNFVGTVKNMTSRYTSITLLDGSSVIIPNDKLVSTIVINNTRVESVVQYHVKVLVPYVLDLEEMMEEIKNAPAVFDFSDDSSEPFVFIEEYQATGALVGMYFGVKDAKSGRMRIHDEIHRRVLAAFMKKTNGRPQEAFQHRIDIHVDGHSLEKMIKP